MFEKIKGWLRDKFRGKKPKGGRMIGASVGVGGVAGVKSIGRLGAESTPVTSNAPNTPTIYGGTITTTTWNLTCSTFSDPDAGDTHLYTDWEVAADAGFSNIVAQSVGDTVNLTSWQAPGLSVTTQYWARCRHADASSVESANSTAITDTTAASGGVSPFFEEQWASGDFTQEAGGFSWGATTNVVILTDNPHSGTYSARFRYVGKTNPGFAFAELRFTMSPLQEVWFEYYIYIPDGNEAYGGAAYAHRTPISGSSNNKFWKVAELHSGAAVTALLEGYPSTTEDWITRPRPMWGCPLDGQASSERGMTHSDATVDATDLGAWHLFQFHIKVSDVGQANGAWQFKKDGGYVVNETALENDPTQTANAFYKVGYLMGWSDSGFDETTYIFIDDIKFYNSDPGWFA